jgi:hypothetical protein
VTSPQHVYSARDGAWHSSFTDNCITSMKKYDIINNSNADKQDQHMFQLSKLANMDAAVAIKDFILSHMVHQIRLTNAFSMTKCNVLIQRFHCCHLTNTHVRENVKRIWDLDSIDMLLVGYFILFCHEGINIWGGGVKNDQSNWLRKSKKAKTTTYGLIIISMNQFDFYFAEIISPMNSSSNYPCNITEVLF